MRKTTTTWRRLQSGEWKQSISLTVPYARPVLDLLNQWPRDLGKQNDANDLCCPNPTNEPSQETCPPKQDQL